MPFNFLLWKCLLPGQTSIRESGKGARIKPEAGECVLAFGIDSQDFRRRFDASKVCDALFFYKSKEQDPVLLFVELKGSDLGSAAQQLGEALQAVRGKLKLKVHYRAVVVSRSTAPGRSNPLRRKFSKEHKLPLEICRSGDLRQYL